MTAPTVLAGYDGHSREGVRTGAALARLIDGQLLIGLGSGAASAAGDDALVRAVGPLARAVPVTRRPLEHGDPGLALARLGHEVQATAIVLGPDLGVHTQGAVLARATRPVVLAADDGLASAGDEARIGVAYDGGPAAELALASALAIAAPHRLPLTLVGVVRHEADAGRMADVLEAARRRIDAVPVEVELRVGSPREQLHEAGHGLDLLCAGARDRRPRIIGRLGSVSHALTEHPPCSLLVAGAGVPAQALPLPATR